MKREAARIDGASLWQELWHVLRPMAFPGLSYGADESSSKDQECQEEPEKGISEGRSNDAP